MKKYLIKATITGGAHEGETFLLEKGGYVVPKSGLTIKERYFKTEAAAKMVATKWNQRNDYYQRAGSTTIEPTKYEAVEVE